MALKPAEPATRHALLRLAPFDPTLAELVASWVLNNQEALWLAPKTVPPLSADDIRQWNRPGHQAWQLVGPGRPTPVAYGELNSLHGGRGHFWLGHLIVSPALRGRGLGRVLTGRLLKRAFHVYGAENVSLVVFPTNQAAIACYRAAGLQPDGYEQHRLPAGGGDIRLLRMVATAAG